MFVLQLASH
jgi:hypothetical protein